MAVKPASEKVFKCMAKSCASMLETLCNGLEGLEPAKISIKHGAKTLNMQGKS